MDMKPWKDFTWVDARLSLDLLITGNYATIGKLTEHAGFDLGCRRGLAQGRKNPQIGPERSFFWPAAE